MQTFDEFKFMAAVAHLLGAVSVAITNVTSGTAQQRTMTVSFVAMMPQSSDAGAVLSSLTDDVVASHLATEGMQVTAAHVVMPQVNPQPPRQLVVLMLNDTGSAVQVARNAALTDCEGCSTAHKDDKLLLWVLLWVLLSLLLVLLVGVCVVAWMHRRPVARVHYSYDRTKKLKL